VEDSGVVSNSNWKQLMTFILTEMFPTKEQQLLAVVKPLGALQNEVQKRPPQKTKI